MFRLGCSVFVVMAFVSGAAQAQSHQPYAGMQTRAIKALSDRELDDLKLGRGMGLALAAELNGYPGPMHVLELADQLGLSVEQRAQVERLIATMRSEAVPLGERLIAQEADLDRQFSTRTITGAGLAASVQSIGETQALLRATHLKFHLSTVEILTSAQRQRYAALRGYGGASSASQPHHDHH
jgi:hypothetical protein